MKRVIAPTLEALSERGGVARYLSAVVETFPDQVKVVELPKQPNYQELFSVFWNNYRNADLYFVNHILPVGTVAWMTRMVGSRPYVIFLHGMDFDLARRTVWKRWLTKRILKSAQVIVVNSEILKREVEGFLGASTRILVVHPPVSDAFVEISKSVRKGVGLVDLKELLKLASGALGVPISTHNNLSSDKPVMLLTVSRLVERKGHLKVLEILEHFPNVHYTIVGEGPMREKIEQEISRRGLGNRVVMMGSATNEDLPGIYAGADIFVMPTTQTAMDREGFGIVYLEASLFGLPVIATKVGGVAEAVIDGETGLLTNDKIDELEGVLRTLIQNPALRTKLGSHGRERVLREFTREVQMGKLRDIL